MAWRSRADDPDRRKEMAEWQFRLAAAPLLRLTDFDTRAVVMIWRMGKIHIKEYFCLTPRLNHL